MHEAILLDLDGTLVDSAPELAVAVNEVRREFGLPAVSLESVREWVGEGVEALLGRALAESPGYASDPGACTSARAVFDAAYGRVLGTEAVLYPGVAEGLARLRAAGIPLACVTNKPEGFARDLLAALGILEPIDAVVGGDTAATRKPDAAPARFAAEQLGVAIEACLVVGDSRIDVDTARNAGCAAWCVRTGYDRGEPVDTLGADAVFDGFGDVVEAVLAERAQA